MDVDLVTGLQFCGVVMIASFTVNIALGFVGADWAARLESWVLAGGVVAALIGAGIAMTGGV
jgi:hypothetical protein